MLVQGEFVTSYKLTIKQRLKLLEKSAKKRNISVDMNAYIYEKMLKIGCIFCGESLLDKGGYCLDRHDNTKGYTEDNSSPCCIDCNKAKGTRTPQEYFDWIKKSFRFQENIRECIKKDGPIPKKQLKKKQRIRQNSRKYKMATHVKLEGAR